MAPVAIPTHRRRLGRWSLTLAALSIVGLGIIVAELARAPVIPAARFNVAPVTLGDLRPVVRGGGRLEPWAVSHVHAAAAGLVERVLVRPGQQVVVGDVLATLERGPALLETRRADAYLARAESSAAETQLRLERALEQIEGNGQTQPDGDDRATDSEVSAAIAYARHAAASAEVAARQATLSLARTRLRAATVKAATAGIVAAVLVEPGSAVAVGDRLFTVAAQGSALRVAVRVGDADIGRIRLGQRAVLSATAFPGRGFPAAVVDAPLFSAGDATTAGFPVVLQLENETAELKAGMSIDATIEVAPVSHVLRVPASALAFVPAGAAGADPSQPAIWTVRDGEPIRIPVAVGVQEGALVEVRGEGLFEGTPVIVSGPGGRS